jgi:hypothetical protein
MKQATTNVTFTNNGGNRKCKNLMVTLSKIFGVPIFKAIKQMTKNQIS